MTNEFAPMARAEENSGGIA